MVSANFAVPPAVMQLSQPAEKNKHMMKTGGTFHGYLGINKAKVGLMVHLHCFTAN